MRQGGLQRDIMCSFGCVFVCGGGGQAWSGFSAAQGSTLGRGCRIRKLNIGITSLRTERLCLCQGEAPGPRGFPKVRLRGRGGGGGRCLRPASRRQSRMTRAVVQAPHEGRRDRCVSRATGRGRHRAGTLAHSANRVQQAPPAQGCRANGNDLTAPPRAGSELANPGAAPPRMRIRPGACTRGLCCSDSEGSLGSGGRAQGCPAAPLGWSQCSAGLRGQRAVLPPPRSPRKPPETERCLPCP